jgi:MYXO-CTERM domain-containing protein
VARACDDLKPEFACEYNSTGCPISENRPQLFWPSRCISWGFNLDGSDKFGIDYEAANAAAEQAVSNWLNADCAGDVPGVHLLNTGPIDCGRVEYNQTGNANVFLFTDDAWPFGQALSTIALTIIQFSTETGEIFDADIAINSATMAFTTDPEAEDGYPLSSVLTHEVGHFLGLGHSEVSSAIMAARYAESTGEALTSDDTEGVCALHPPDAAASNDDCTPRHGFSGECGGRVPEASGGCSVSAPSSRSSAPWAALGVALLGARLRRRGRR